MYFLYKNKHRIFKPVEITIRRRLKVERKKKQRGWTNSGCDAYIHGNVTMKHPVQLSYTNKNDNNFLISITV
jgi:hypothetical protein